MFFIDILLAYNVVCRIKKYM